MNSDYPILASFVNTLFNQPETVYSGSDGISLSFRTLSCVSKESFYESFTKSEISTNNDTVKDQICTVCQNDLDNEVIMPCGGMHKFCFDCIINWTQKYYEGRSNELASGPERSLRDIVTCPCCRKECEYLIVPQIKNEDMKNFCNSIEFLFPKRHNKFCYCYNKELINTCLYPIWFVNSYINNKNQLKMLNVLVKTSNLDLDTIIDSIKWT